MGYGGILGLKDFYAKEDTPIYDPQNYVDSVISEDVNVGVAMFERAECQYSKGD